MMVRMNENFYRIDAVLSPVLGINWVETLGEDNYYLILELSDNDILKFVEDNGLKT